MNKIVFFKIGQAIGFMWVFALEFILTLGLVISTLHLVGILTYKDTLWRWGGTLARSFSAVVDDWVNAVPERVEAVRKQAFQETIKIAQKPRAKGGNMRVDTGFLRASGQVTLNTPLLTTEANPYKPGKGVQVRYNNMDVSVKIASATPKDKMYFSYTANYAVPRERKDGFVRVAAAQWPATVRRVANNLARRAGVG